MVQNTEIKVGSMSVVGENLKRYMEENHIETYYQLELLVGKDQGQLKKIVIGKTDPISKTVAEIADKLGVEPEYFYKRITPAKIEIDKVKEITAKEPVSTAFIEDLQAVINKHKTSVIKSISEVFEVPIIGRAPAGKPCVLNESRGETVVIRLEQLEGASTKDIFAITVDGESLAGDQIHDGYNLVFRKVSEVDIENKIYLCSIRHECTLKHCKWVGGKIRLYGTNSNFEDFEPDQCEIKGRCIIISPPDLKA